jgi:hypothetical protein
MRRSVYAAFGGFPHDEVFRRGMVRFRSRC